MLKSPWFIGRSCAHEQLCIRQHESMHVNESGDDIYWFFHEPLDTTVIGAHRTWTKGTYLSFYRDHVDKILFVADGQSAQPPPYKEIDMEFINKL